MGWTPDRLGSEVGLTQGAADRLSARPMGRLNTWAVPAGTEAVLSRRGLLRGDAVVTMPARVLPRSVVHFVGDSELPHEGCKWVVKQSNPRGHQDDLEDPLD